MKKIFIIECIILIFCSMTTVYAKEAGGVSLNEIQSSSKIPVKIQIEVPKGFDSDVRLKYSGKKTEGFLITLSEKENYSIELFLKEDTYILKRYNISNNCTLQIDDIFFIKGGEFKKYLLKGLVERQDSKQSRDGYITIKITADIQEALSQHDMQVVYSGTNGNIIAFDLNKANAYTNEINIKQDVYTLHRIEPDDEYIYDTLYSFNTKKLNSENYYMLRVGVKKAEEEVELEIRRMANKQTQKVLINLQKPEELNFTGDVFISYLKDKAETIDIKLSRENHYSEAMQLSEGSYQLQYAVSYDIDKYTIYAEPQFTIDGTHNAKELNIRFLKKGLAAGDKEDNGGEKVLLSDEKAEDGDDSYVHYVVIAVSIIITLAVIVYAVLRYIKFKMNFDSDVDDIYKTYR